MIAFFAIAALLSPPVTDIQADRMELDQGQRRVVFTGSVQASQGALRLSCERLEAHYAEGGALESLEATGSLKLRGDGLEAGAGKARYEAEAATLVLTGNPWVVRGGDRLEGARVIFWPDTGRLVVEGARGRIQAPNLEALGQKLSP